MIHANFEGNPAYVREMEALGHKVSESRLMELALHDVSIDFVRELKDLGYGKVSVDRLVEFRIHGVTPEFVREIQNLGYRDVDSEKLVEFRIHEVTPEIIRELRTQYMIGFYPKNVPLTKDRFHKLEVKVRQPDLRVSARNGYYGEVERLPAGSAEDRVSLSPDRQAPPPKPQPKKKL